MEANEGKYARIQPEMMNRTMPLEITAEIALPDYRSEISRLLWVRPTFLPPERYIGGGKAEFSGQVLFEVLYTGPDGALYGADAEEGYAFSVPLEGLAGMQAVEIFADPVVDTVISRVTGPRKLSVRCRMHACVHAYAEKVLETKRKGEGKEAALCMLSDAVEAGRLLCSAKEEHTLNDTIRTEGEVRVICARGSVFLPEAVPATDEVRCRGEVALTLLLCKEEQSAAPFTLSCRIPFEKPVMLEGVRPDHQACAVGTVGRVEVAVEEGEIHVTPHLILNAQAQYNEPVTVCRDVFLPDYSAEYVREKESFWQDGGCCNKHFSISGELPLQEAEMGEDCEILDLTAEAEIGEKAVDGAKIALSGKLQCHLLCRQGGELCVKDVAFPFRVLPECGSEGMELTAQLPQCRVSIRSGKLCATAELQLAIRDTRPVSADHVREVSFTPAPPQERAAIELYYPANGETLWDVAKRYALSPEALADANALDADAPAARDSLSGKSFLLIPND